MTNFLRPDEQAMNAGIEKSKRSDERFKGALKTGASAVGALGAGAAAFAGGKLGAKILPFLNEYIPYNLALKGINKVSPQLGGFLKKGMEQGLDLKDGLEYLKRNIGEEEKQQPVKENRNIIQQYSPELFQFLEEQIKQGRDPIQAGAVAQNDKKFSPIIQKISKDHKADWSSILQTVFGQGEPSQTQQTQPNQQQGQGAQAIAQAMQRINSLLGG